MEASSREIGLDALYDFITPFKERAAKLTFPDLLNHVNAKLRTPLQFSDAYQSLQNTRNCLEHRNGIVSERDVDGAGMMHLSFPYVRVFYERFGKEVEIEAGIPVDAEDGKDEVQLLMKIDLRMRSFTLYDRLEIAAADFDEIVFAAYYFGTELAAKLPTSPSN